MSAPLPDSVFFYCASQGRPEQAGYQHCTVCLAEGFRSLGVDVVGNIDYWRINPDSEEHLIEARAGLEPSDCSLVIVNESWLQNNRELPAGLFASGRPYVTVFVDSADGAQTQSRDPRVQAFDLILKTHANRRFAYPVPVKPWAFGLSERMLAGIARASAPDERTERLLFNFRVPSPVRAKARAALEPLASELPFDSRSEPVTERPVDPVDALWWEQSGRRHHPAYYERLVASSACAAFGGWLLSPWPRDPGRAGIGPRLLRNLPFGPQRILQFDSWRFWESLAAGCATFHVDFDRYGAVLPVMPESGTHYFGIDLDKATPVIDSIAEQPGSIANVGAAGRQWALDHYAPVPTVRRLLSLLHA